MRLAALLCLWLGLTGTLAAAPPPALTERSLLQPGLWWSPAYSGRGFDSHLSGCAIGVVWYASRADGTPVWYLATGMLDAAGVLDTDLLEAR